MTTLTVESCLFQAVRSPGMRAVQLSGGKPDEYGLPQWWVMTYGGIKLWLITQIF